MSRLSKNIIYNFLGQGLLLILGFISVKYIFKQLGEDALGIIYFTLAILLSVQWSWLRRISYLANFFCGRYRLE